MGGGGEQEKARQGKRGCTGRETWRERFLRVLVFSHCNAYLSGQWETDWCECVGFPLCGCVCSLNSVIMFMVEIYLLCVLVNVDFV